MIDKIINKLRNKKIAILGFGREGRSSYLFIRRYLKKEDITIIDKVNVYDSNKDLFKNDNLVNFVFGDNYLSNLDKYDVIIKSPGVSLNKIDTSSFINKITSQMELLLEFARDRVIGVTGTKGKSTTTSLIYEILKTKYQVLIAGNIGVPIFDLDLTNDKCLFVLEMSSHQLEYLDYSPHIGVVLNLFEDHLDHALTVEHYHEIKMHMFLNQKENDYMIYCSSNEALNNLVHKNNYLGIKMPVNRLGTDDKAIMSLKNDIVYYKKEEVFKSTLHRNLLGKHNLENIMVAYLVGRICKIDSNDILDVISNFKPLPYRIEFVKEVDEVKYYVDTLATIPDATKEAIEAIEDVNTLIFGGLDRGISYKDFISYLNKSNIEHFICMPTTGHIISKELDKNKVILVDTLEEAVIEARKVTKKGMTCLLSPAAASYEYFKNYQEKGDRFKELILGIDKNN